MGWKEFIRLHHDTENINFTSIKVLNTAVDDRKNWYDDVVTKIGIREYQVDTYYSNTNILTDSHIETSIKEYLGY